MKTHASIGIPLALVLALSLAGCENTYWSCLRGNGILEEETRELQEFNGVVTEGDFELFYVPDTSYAVVIESDQNLIPYIRTRMSGKTLIVDNGTRKCLRSEYPIRITVYAPEIRLMSLVGSGMISAESVYGDELRLELEGSGYIDLRGIDVLDLEVLITGSGDVTLWGTSKLAEYTITGSGTISAQNLVSEICTSEISGSGEIYCLATQKLNAFISGSGTIYYRGDPSVTTYISGTGSVISIN